MMLSTIFRAHDEVRTNVPPELTAGDPLSMGAIACALP
jgi:hypothetical protein